MILLNIMSETFENEDKIVLHYLMKGTPARDYVRGRRTITNKKEMYDTPINRILRSLAGLQKDYAVAVSKISDAPKYKQDLWITCNKTFINSVYQWIKLTSEFITDRLLPKEGDDGGQAFAEELRLVDEKIAEDGEYPHFLIVSDEKRIPWWISRTYDRKELWCSRYAVGLLPAGSDDAQLNFEVPLKISILSRSTSDLESAPKIDLDSLLSGLIERHMVLADAKNGNDNVKNAGRFGLQEADIKDGFNSSQVVIYYGHFDTNPYHDPIDNSVKAIGDTILEPAVSIPLGDLELSGKCLILDGCESAGITEGNKCLADALLQKGSTLIGTLYPVFTDHAPDFIKDFCTYLLEKSVSFGEALRRARKIDFNNAISTFNGAAFCLFGDPSLPSPLLSKVIGKSKKTIHMIYPPFLSSTIGALGAIYSYASFVEMSEEDVERVDTLLASEEFIIAAYPVTLAAEKILSGKMDLVILGPILKSRNDFVIFQKAGLNLEKPQEMIGRMLCCRNRDYSGAKMAQLYFKMNNVNPDEINWMTLSHNSIQAVDQGIVDAAIVILSEDGIPQRAKHWLPIDDWIARKVGSAVPRSVLVCSRASWDNEIFRPLLEEILERYNEKVDAIDLSVDRMSIPDGVELTFCKVGNKCDISEINRIIEFTRLLAKYGELKGILEEKHFY